MGNNKSVNSSVTSNSNIFKANREINNTFNEHNLYSEKYIADQLSSQSCVIKESQDNKENSSNDTKIANKKCKFKKNHDKIHSNKKSITPSFNIGSSQTQRKFLKVNNKSEIKIIEPLPSNINSIEPEYTTITEYSTSDTVDASLFKIKGKDVIIAEVSLYESALEMDNKNQMNKELNVNKSENYLDLDEVVNTLNEELLAKKKEIPQKYPNDNLYSQVIISQNKNSSSSNKKSSPSSSTSSTNNINIGTVNFNNIQPTFARIFQKFSSSNSSKILCNSKKLILKQETQSPPDLPTKCFNPSEFLQQNLHPPRIPLPPAPNRLSFNEHYHFMITTEIDIRDEITKTEQMPPTLPGSAQPIRNKQFDSPITKNNDKLESFDCNNQIYTNIDSPSQNNLNQSVYDQIYDTLTSSVNEIGEKNKITNKTGSSTNSLISNLNENIKLNEPKNKFHATQVAACIRKTFQIRNNNKNTNYQSNLELFDSNNNENTSDYAIKL